MLIDLLRKRCSIRDFKEEDIPIDIITKILEAGRLSPSGGNEQAWTFGVITDKDMIHQIAQIAYHQNWIKRAPLLIVLVTRIVDETLGGRDIQMARFPHLADILKEMDKNTYSSLNIEEHQTKIPGTHMVLQAMELGIGSTWISYFDVLKLAELLELPKDYLPSEIIAFGYPKSEFKPRKKKELEELVFFNKWNK